MGEEASRSKAADRLERGTFALAAGIALSAAFGVGYWTRGPAEAPRARRPSLTVTARADRPSPVVAARPEAPAAAKAAVAGAEVAAPPDQGGGSGADPQAVAAEPEAPRPGPFALADPTPVAPPIALLPEAPWFAVAGATGDAAPPPCDSRVCATDRSLSTALRWARSPEEAAERAGRDKKLVFLIHVSGNFEDPGFT
jgi:hypothetical protein